MRHSVIQCIKTEKRSVFLLGQYQQYMLLFSPNFGWIEKCEVNLSKIDFNVSMYKKDRGNMMLRSFLYIETQINGWKFSVYFLDNQTNKMIFTLLVCGNKNTEGI